MTPLILKSFSQFKSGNKNYITMGTVHVTSGIQVS